MVVVGRGVDFAHYQYYHTLSRRLKQLHRCTYSSTPRHALYLMGIFGVHFSSKKGRLCWRMDKSAKSVSRSVIMDGRNPTLDIVFTAQADFMCRNTSRASTLFERCNRVFFCPTESYTQWQYSGTHAVISLPYSGVRPTCRYRTRFSSKKREMSERHDRKDKDSTGRDAL